MLSVSLNIVFHSINLSKFHIAYKTETQNLYWIERTEKKEANYRITTMNVILKLLKCYKFCIMHRLFLPNKITILVRNYSMNPCINCQSKYILSISLMSILLLTYLFNLLAAPSLNMFTYWSYEKRGIKVGNVFFCPSPCFYF